MEMSPIEEIKSRIPEGKKVVFVSGNFNILHPGHLRMLNFAKDCGDYLVVGVNTNEEAPGSIYVPLSQRLNTLRSIDFVDHAFALEEAPESFIKAFQPDVVIKGAEHEKKHNPEQKAVDTYQGKLIFASGDIQYNSKELLRQEFLGQDLPQLRFPTEYMDRHHITASSCAEIIDQFKTKNIVVVGDTIVDKYVTCNPLGMSQEDPTIVVTPVMDTTFIGGAAITAAHAKSLGANVSFFSITGEDDAAKFAKEKLDEYGVQHYFVVDPSRPTPHKMRYRSRGQTLLRVNKISQRDISDKMIAELADRIIDRVSGADALIFSDFNYGCLPQELVDRVSNVCVEKKIPMFGDSQSSSQIGNVSRFKNMSVLTPTEREARLSLHDYKSGLVSVADALRKLSNAQNIVMTLSGEGLLIQTPPEQSEVVTDRIAAFNSSPKDVSGAGDSLLACLTLAMVSGANIWHSCFLASLAAGTQVSRVGNIPLKREELLRELGH